MDLLGGPRPTNKEHNAQHISPVLYGKDFRHPWTNPLKVFRSLDRPNKQYPPSRHSTLVVSVDEVLDVGNRMRDADTTSKENNSAIRVE